MRTPVLGFALLAIALPAGSQQSLPTKQQCRVDEKYFSAEAQRSIVQMMNSPKHLSDISLLPVEELRQRSTEMLLCSAVDRSDVNGYGDASGYFAAVAEQREYDFIKRHHLLSEFHAEDEALVKAAGGK